MTISAPAGCNCTWTVGRAYSSMPLTNARIPAMEGPAIHQMFVHVECVP